MYKFVGLVSLKCPIMQFMKVKNPGITAKGLVLKGDVFLPNGKKVNSKTIKPPNIK
jgi:hypothetical protein